MQHPKKPLAVIDWPPLTGPIGMLVHRWPLGQRGRWSRLGLRSWPRGEG